MRRGEATFPDLTETTYHSSECPNCIHKAARIYSAAPPFKPRVVRHGKQLSHSDAGLHFQVAHTLHATVLLALRRKVKGDTQDAAEPGSHRVTGILRPHQQKNYADNY